MTLLNHLFGKKSTGNRFRDKLGNFFGNKKNTANRLEMDDVKRLKLWEEHLSNFDLRESLCTEFNYANANKALNDFSNTKKTLEKIESLISPELININNEEKTDEEILADLNKLKSNDEIEEICDAVVDMEQKSSKIIELFQEMHDVLKAELHLIRLIKDNPTKDLLIKLFRMIYYQEAWLYKVFRGKTFREESKDIHKEIIEISSMILLEQEIKEKELTEEEMFAKNMVEEMKSDEESEYLTLGEDIFFTLASMAGVPLPQNASILDGLRQMESFIKDDSVMYTVIKKLKPKFTDVQIKGSVIAFRKAFDKSNFLGLEDVFAEKRLYLGKFDHNQ